jgi:hypothetical protein
MSDEIKVTAQVNTRLPIDLARAIWAAAAKLDRKPAEWARRAFEEKLSRDAKPARKAGR